MSDLASTQVVGLPADAELAALLRQLLPGARMAWLFGSAAKGTMRPDSDIDIAVWRSAPLTAADRFTAACAAAEVLNRDVDLLDFQRLPTPMQLQVIQSGRLLFASDPMEVLNLQARVLREFQDMQRWRAPLVRELTQRLREGTPV